MKRKSTGSAIYWARGNKMLRDKYLHRYYPIHDWGIIKHFFKENPIQAKIILQDFRKTNEAKQREVLNILLHGKSKIVYIIGARGKGKTCTSAWLVSELYKLNNKISIYFVGAGIRQMFPKEWAKYENKIQDVPNNSFIVLDEASIRYSAREFYKESNILLGKYLAIARHKGLTVIFITQHAGMIDINIRRLRDIVIWKPSNDYTFTEGKGKDSTLKKFYDKIRYNMAPRNIDEVLLEYPAEKRFIHFKHEKPLFWTEELSKAFSSFQFGSKDDGKEIDSGGFIRKKKRINQNVIRIG